MLWLFDKMLFPICCVVMLLGVWMKAALFLVDELTFELPGRSPCFVTVAEVLPVCG